MKTFIVALGMLSPVIAQAHGWDWHRPRPVRQCVHGQTFVTGSRTEVVSACEQLRPLQLANKESYFPNLRGGNYQVDYWDGAYAYCTRTVTTYQTVVSNDCTGETLSSDTSESVTEGMQEFAVPNPNLDPAIHESFRLSPMLPEEAATAFAQAQAECLGALSRQ